MRPACYAVARPLPLGPHLVLSGAIRALAVLADFRLPALLRADRVAIRGAAVLAGDASGDASAPEANLIGPPTGAPDLPRKFLEAAELRMDGRVADPMAPSLRALVPFRAAGGVAHVGLGIADLLAVLAAAVLRVPLPSRAFLREVFADPLRLLTGQPFALAALWLGVIGAARVRCHARPVGAQLPVRSGLAPVLPVVADDPFALAAQRGEGIGAAAVVRNAEAVAAGLPARATVVPEHARAIGTLLLGHAACVLRDALAVRAGPLRVRAAARLRNAAAAAVLLPGTALARGHAGAATAAPAVVAKHLRAPLLRLRLRVALLLALPLGLELSVRLPLRLGLTLRLGLCLVLVLRLRLCDLGQTEPGDNAAECTAKEDDPKRVERLSSGSLRAPATDRVS